MRTSRTILLWNTQILKKHTNIHYFIPLGKTKNNIENLFKSILFVMLKLAKAGITRQFIYPMHTLQKYSNSQQKHEISCC